MNLDPRRLFIHAVLRRMVKTGRIDTVAEYVRVKQQNPDSYVPPSGKATDGIDVSEQTVADTLTYRLSPRQSAAPRCFVYFHGGSFVGQIVSGQWDLVLELVRGSGNTGLVPIYPLAPHETAEQTVPRSAAAISAAVKEFGAQNVSILGDSAGGTIAVAAVQQLRDAGAELPAQLILLAPWLDLPMAHPDQAAIEPHDIMVRREYLTEAGRVYAGALPMNDWRVSPLFGSFSNLPPMRVFTGSHDVIVTDSRQLVERVREAGGEITYVEAPGMQHAYPIYPLLPEARKAKKAIAKLLR